MKASSPWITYRTRFLVKAKQLTTASPSPTCSAVNTPAARATTSSNPPTVFFASRLGKSSRIFMSLCSPAKLPSPSPPRRRKIYRHPKPGRDELPLLSLFQFANFLNPTAILHPVCARSAIELDSICLHRIRPASNAKRTRPPRFFPTLQRCTNGLPSRFWVAQRSQYHGIQPARGFWVAQRFQRCDESLSLDSALAREVPKTPNIISSQINLNLYDHHRSSAPASTNTAAPQPPAQPWKSGASAPRNPYQNDWGFSPCADL